MRTHYSTRMILYYLLQLIGSFSMNECDPFLGNATISFLSPDVYLEESWKLVQNVLTSQYKDFFFAKFEDNLAP